MERCANAVQTTPRLISVCVSQGTARRKKKVVHKTATDDKKLQVCGSIMGVGSALVVVPKLSLFLLYLRSLHARSCTFTSVPTDHCLLQS